MKYEHNVFYIFLYVSKKNKTVYYINENLITKNPIRVHLL